jgi:thymidylate synthase (FAD)
MSDLTNEPSDEPVFRDDVTVELVKSSVSDNDVVWAARVSTAGEQSLESVGVDGTRDAGLIRYLMRDRHGCFDAETEVLTREGWKSWPTVTGDEEFCTRSTEGRIEYQRALRLVAKPVVDAPMIRVSLRHVDALVTADHNMFAMRRLQPHRSSYQLVPAWQLTQACHRLAMGGGEWVAEEAPNLHAMALLGFFIGDGHYNGGSVEFRLRKQREITFLTEQAKLAGFPLHLGAGDRFRLIADEEFRLLAKKCYTEARAKVVPAEVLDLGPRSLAAVMTGLMHSDGSVGERGKRTYSTTSLRLAGQIQELALKLGEAATVRDHPFDNDPCHYGSKPRYCVTIYRERWSQPRVGWTTEARAREVQETTYTGTVYCVTVPNGTLYVRRNGKPMWSGNSPFEHNSMTFFVSAPILVFREWMRHRIGWSYNESSGRYAELQPVFYVPAPERRLVQEGKPGAYVFVEGSEEQHRLVVDATKKACTDAYAAYQDMLRAGIAREVARGVLPVCTFSSMYATCNARSLMAFLSLRTKREDSKFPSYPQREIEMAAEKMEAEWARLMPITYEAFNANGRVSP